MENLAVEIHDMRIKTVRVEPDAVVVEFSATIFASEGVPAEDPGVEFFQSGELIIAAGSVRATPVPTTLWVIDGAIEVGGEEYDNIVPLPFRLVGPTSLRFEGVAGVLEILGSGAVLTLTGERTKATKYPPEPAINKP